MQAGDRLLRLKEVLGLCSFGRSTLYRRMRDDDFPEPVKIGPRAVRWVYSEIVAWIESRPRAMGEP